MPELASQIESPARVISQNWPVTPQVGLILGTGLGRLAEEISIEYTINYANLPQFSEEMAEGQRGRLVCGQFEGVPIMAFQGRFHLYQGSSPQQAALPVRLMQQLGAKTLIVSNAAGGLNPAYAVGDVMLIEDQINFMFANPLVGINDDKLGPRFPDMSQPYDSGLAGIAVSIARQHSFALHQGVYASMLGPTYETRAEYRMLRRLGADAVGMSTVPEVLAARHAGMRVLGLSTITNIGLPDALSETTGHDVVAAAESAVEKLKPLMSGVVRSL
ncbi:MAG: purine-nucleoside phosphorylase [Planctomycetes bacterium]|nr:purine-nucleoside phosphorylase [Planctomycetota bacterium]